MPRMSASDRAGLKFPVGRTNRYLHACVPDARVSPGAAVYLASVMEYLSAELLEIAGNAASGRKASRIQPRDIAMALKVDDELRKAANAVTPLRG